MFDFLSKAAESIGNGLGKVGEFAGNGLAHVAERLQDEDFQQSARLFSAAMSNNDNKYQSALTAYDQRKAEIAKQKQEALQRAEQRQWQVEDKISDQEFTLTRDANQYQQQEDMARLQNTFQTAAAELAHKNNISIMEAQAILNMELDISKELPIEQRVQMLINKVKNYGQGQTGTNTSNNNPNTPGETNNQTATPNNTSTYTVPGALSLSGQDEVVTVGGQPETKTEGYDFEGFYKGLGIIESSNNPDARNSKSTALGLYQITKPTAEALGYKWEDMTKPEVAREAVEKLTKQHYNAFQQKFGVEPTHGQLYMMHQQGQGAAFKMMDALKTNPNAKAVDILGKDQVLNNGGTADMTIQEFDTMWDEKVKKHTSAQPANTSVQQTTQQPVNDSPKPAATNGTTISGTGTSLDGVTVQSKPKTSKTHVAGGIIYAEQPDGSWKPMTEKTANIIKLNGQAVNPDIKFGDGRYVQIVNSRGTPIVNIKGGTSYVVDTQTGNAMWLNTNAITANASAIQANEGLAIIQHLEDETAKGRGLELTGGWTAGQIKRGIGDKLGFSYTKDLESQLTAVNGSIEGQIVAVLETESGGKQVQLAKVQAEKDRIGQLSIHNSPEENRAVLERFKAFLNRGIQSADHANAQVPSTLDNTDYGHYDERLVPMDPSQPVKSHGNSNSHQSDVQFDMVKEYKGQSYGHIPGTDANKQENWVLIK